MTHVPSSNSRYRWWCRCCPFVIWLPILYKKKKFKNDCLFLRYYSLMSKKKIMLSTCSEGWTIALRLVQLHIYGIWCLTFMHFPSYAWCFLVLLSALGKLLCLYFCPFRTAYFSFSVWCLPPTFLVWDLKNQVFLSWYYSIVY